MASFESSTFIRNTPAIVFDLSRDIDLHIVSTGDTNEKAVAGVTSGLIGLNETVTWEAKHLFKKPRFTSKITDFDSPHSFTDEMMQGDLKSFRHRHTFTAADGGTLMTDHISLEAPYGLLGRMVAALFLKHYFKRFLVNEMKSLRKWQNSKSCFRVGFSSLPHYGNYL